MFYIVHEYSAQPACSHLCGEDVGHMGKEPIDSCIPHRAYYRTAVVLSISYVSLTRVIGGLCNIGDHSLCIFLSRFPGFVASLHLLGGEPAI